MGDVRFLYNKKVIPNNWWTIFCTFILRSLKLAGTNFTSPNLVLVKIPQLQGFERKKSNRNNDSAK